jgi:hypothetical protein
MRRLILLLAVIGCEVKKEQQPSSLPPAETTAVSPQPSPAAPSTSDPRPSVCGEAVITDEGIGELRIGTTVESIRQKCTVVSDKTAPGAEGMPARKLRVALSRDTVEAEIVDGRVWRIAVRSPRLRTADSLGVGTTLASLLQLRNPRGMTGEGRFYVASPDHCGMSFRLANAGPGAQRGDLDNAGLARLPRSAVVSEVLVFGCRSQTSGG